MWGKPMRLNAFLAECGVSSRRKAEQLILNGEIRVNGKIVLAPYLSVTPGVDMVEYQGKNLEALPKVYLAMNKPPGVVCAVTDKYDPVVVGLLPQEMKNARVFPVGRLDRDSEGLLILTNDGSFAQSIQHPSKNVTKEYEILLNLEINHKQLKRWRSGFEIEGKLVKPIEVETMWKEPQGRWLRVVVGEGLKREVRTMAKLAGFSVLVLVRRKVGYLILKKLQLGEFVELSFSDLCTRIFKGGSV
ncbi:MAG: pseudouridine synthase [Synergistaceae bacterium]|jgi:23S rRNA pseudouridine2605 synthase|nr:pseudouridine synthase [Synergistaceae bacterium]